MPRDRFFNGGCFLLLFSKVRFDFVGLDHQFELVVLDLADFTFVPLDLVPDCPKFIILARLILLGFEARDCLGASPHIQLKFLTVYLDVSRFLFEGFHSRHACG